MPRWVAKGRIGTVLLASEMPIPIPRNRTVRPGTRKPTVGGGAASSGACGPPSAWHVLRPLPCPRRFLEKAIRGPEPGAQVFEPLHLTPDLRAPTGRQKTFSCLCLSFCLYVNLHSLLSVFVFLSV